MDVKDNPKYSQMGVTPTELYMRQNGLCWLRPEIKPDGSIILYCTDDSDKVETCQLLNPTYECANCLAKFAIKAMETAVRGQPVVVVDTEGSKK